MADPLAQLLARVTDLEHARDKWKHAAQRRTTRAEERIIELEREVARLTTEVAACKAANRILVEGATDENVDAYLKIVEKET